MRRSDSSPQSGSRRFLFRDSSANLYREGVLNVLLLYFFTGFLANYEVFVHINSAILVFLAAYAFLTPRRQTSALSPLITVYGLLTLISLANHCRWIPQAGLPQEARTMPVVLVAMIACRWCAVPGLFERAITVNAIPFLLLIPIGGHFEGARYYSTFLDENMHGQVLPLAFAVGLVAVWERRYQWRPLAALAASLMQMFLGAARKMFFFLLLSVFVIVTFNRKLSGRHVLLAVATLLLTLAIAMPLMTRRQQERLGGDFTWQDQISALLSREATDKSVYDRTGFIELAFNSVRHDWLGFGNGNFPYVVSCFGTSDLPEAGHPHSGLAESLITAGYPGAVLYLFMLAYLFRIGRHDQIMRICLIWLFLQVFVETTLSNRMLWPLLAIAERELQLSAVNHQRGG